MFMLKPELSQDKELAVKSKKKQKTESDKALLTLGGIMGTGVIGIIIYALQSSNRVEFVSFASVGIMVGGCSALLGGLLGFLFGIPRTLQQDSLIQTPIYGNDTNSSDTGVPKTDYRANTNLEQISDWLTKILVGVGLTQFSNIPIVLQQISSSIANGLGNTNASRTFALSTILFFLISGFLFSYLWTRLYLPGAFKKADLNSLAIRVERTSSQVKQVNKKLADIEKQAELDATALTLAQRQLNPGIDIPPLTQEQLNTSIKAASHSMKLQIFYLAQNQRSFNWVGDKTKMELTIPIFKALIEDDYSDKFHRNHGQLGYALKDRNNPDWVGALDELNKAIKIRGPWREKGWLYYELNRAICKMNLDADYRNNKSSKSEVRDLIITDLRAAFRYMPSVVTADPDVKKWCSLNNVDVNDLQSNDL